MIFEKLQENPYAWAILSLCTIISLFLAFWALIKGKKKLEFSYCSVTRSIIRDGKNLIPGIQLLYQGESIDNLAITRYAIWNSGTDILRYSDIVDSRPLQISTDDAEILDAIIIKQSDETNEFKVSEKSEKRISLEFDYANKQDGIVIQVIHTGDISSFKVDCKIKGGQQAKNLNERPRKQILKKIKEDKKTTILIGGILCVFELFLSIILLLCLWGIIESDSPSLFDLLLAYEGNDINKAAFDACSIVSLMIILGVVFVFFSYWKMLKKYYINIPFSLRNDIYSDSFE